MSGGITTCHDSSWSGRQRNCTSGLARVRPHGRQDDQTTHGQRVTDGYNNEFLLFLTLKHINVGVNVLDKSCRVGSGASRPCHFNLLLQSVALLTVVNSVEGSAVSKPVQ